MGTSCLGPSATAKCTTQMFKDSSANTDSRPLKVHETVLC